MSLNDDTTDLDTNQAGDGQDGGGEHTGDDNDAGAAAVAASLAGGGGDGEFVIEGEKKPTNQSTLLLFGLILVAAGGFYFMYMRGGPDKAAANAANAEAQQAKQAISEFLDGGEKNMQAMQKMLQDTEKVVDQFRQYPSMKQVPLESLQANPFQFKLPKTTDPDAIARAEAEAARKKQEEERQAILKKVEELSLQTIIASGSRKACMINGTLFQEGQVVDGFTIDKIEPAGVIVKNGAYRFVLKMKK